MGAEWGQAGSSVCFAFSILSSVCIHYFIFCLFCILVVVAVAFCYEKCTPCLSAQESTGSGGSVNGLENHLFVIALVIDILGQSNHIAEEEERIQAAIAAHWTTSLIHNILTHQQMRLQKCFFNESLTFLFFFTNFVLGCVEKNGPVPS